MFVSHLKPSRDGARFLGFLWEIYGIFLSATLDGCAAPSAIRYTPDYT